MELAASFEYPKYKSITVRDQRRWCLTLRPGRWLGRGSAAIGSASVTALSLDPVNSIVKVHDKQ